MKRFLLFLFAATTFLGSFLLFQIQPVISKFFLPWFGGTSAVWTTALLFFQVVLLLGYLYTFLLTKLPQRIQVLIHCLLIGSITGILMRHFSLWYTPIMPDTSWRPDTSMPLFSVLFLLTISIGAPYFLLATTSTLLQKWFHALSPQTSPYPLYALSNAGSLLALLSYPFIIEPLVNMQHQGKSWSIIFLGFCVLMISCTLLVLSRSSSLKPSQKKQSGQYGITPRTYALWIFLSCLPSLMLIASSQALTQSIAPVPFLWLLPLGLYLLSFILCFSNQRWYHRNTHAYIVLAASPLVFISTQVIVPMIVLSILLYAAFLFALFMLCHGELYRLKPPPALLDRFYLFVAIGGAIGGLLVALIAPLLLPQNWEFTIGICASIGLSLFLLIQPEASQLHTAMRRFFSSKKEFYLFATLALSCFLLLFTVLRAYVVRDASVYTYRNFYGILTVIRKTQGNKQITSVSHGKITHGSQVFINKKYEPSMYYGKNSGAGLVLTQYPSFVNRPLRVGVIGLGAGTLAAYGRKGDIYRFYEINPTVAMIAKKYFTYLQDSPATIDIIIDDGRLALEKEVGRDEKFDLLIIDAFSDDAIPTHLLTKEAFDLYKKRLTADGVIALHISNTYLDLLPVTDAVADYHHMASMFIHTNADGVTSPSDWAILTSNADFLKTLRIPKEKGYIMQSTKTVPLWTDDFSNLIFALK